MIPFILLANRVTGLFTGPLGTHCSGLLVTKLQNPVSQFPADNAYYICPR